MIEGESFCLLVKISNNGAICDIILIYFIPVYVKYTTNGTVGKSKYVLDVCGWYMLVCLHMG